MRINVINPHFTKYPTYYGLKYFYSFGSALAIYMTIQIISGLLLVSSYSNNIENTFDSIDYITNDTNIGFFWRFLHMNVASLLFFLLFLHIGRYVYYGLDLKMDKSNKRVLRSGYLLLILIITVSFLGYVLPFGQMSFWSCTVITNLIAVVPYGERLLQLIWGNVLVGDSTLKRFFLLHFILPFVIAVGMLLHMYLLHNKGSSDYLNNKSYITNNLKKTLYLPLILKDLMVVLILFIFILLIILKNPYIFANPVNEIKANSLITPEHILPEWYFLSFYAILKFIPNKMEGIFYMVLYIGSLFFIFGNIDKPKKKINIFFSYFNKYIVIFTFYSYSIMACDTIFNNELNILVLLLFFFRLIYIIINKLKIF